MTCPLSVWVGRLSTDEAVLAIWSAAGRSTGHPAKTGIGSMVPVSAASGRLTIWSGHVRGSARTGGKGRPMLGMLSILAELQRELIVANTVDRLSPEQAIIAQQLYDTREKTAQRIADLFGAPARLCTVA